MAKRWAGRLLLILSGLLAGVLIVEVGLRIAGYSSQYFYKTDQYRGISLRPNAEGWWRKEGEAYVLINSDGLRDREHTREKSANTLRIAVLGDSYAEAFHVPMENAFWSVMERQLQQCQNLVGKRVEVINFGAAGYGTAQELITLRQHVWSYSPDIVLLAVTTGNDISDNSRAFKNYEDVPYFIYRDGELVLDASFRDSRKFRLRQSILYRWLREYSRVVETIIDVHHVIRNYMEHRRQDVALGNDNLEELGLDTKIYLEPDSSVWKDAWWVTEELIVLMENEVWEKGARFLVVTLSNPIQVHPDPSVRYDYAKRLGLEDLLYPDMRIKALGEREGFSVLNLVPVLQVYAEQHKALLHGFGRNIGGGHWNKVGHRVAGEVIAQRLCEGMHVSTAMPLIF